MNKNFDGGWEDCLLALGTLQSDCLCRVECERNQNADNPGETACILVGEDVGETGCGYSTDLSSYMLCQVLYCTGKSLLPSCWHKKHHVHLIISKASPAVTWSFSPGDVHLSPPDKWLKNLKKIMCKIFAINEEGFLQAHRRPSSCSYIWLRS